VIGVATRTRLVLLGCTACAILVVCLGSYGLLLRASVRSGALTSFGPDVFEYFGVRWTFWFDDRYGESPLGLPKDPDAVESVSLVEVGWPFAAFRRAEWHARETVPPGVLRIKPRYMHPGNLVLRLGQYRPMVAGFLGDVAVWAVGLGLLTVLPMRAVRALRERQCRRAGCCPKCGYALTGLASGRECPECGTRPAL
jgi:hypothetical protein